MAAEIALVAEQAEPVDDLPGDDDAGGGLDRGRRRFGRGRFGDGRRYGRRRRRGSVEHGRGGAGTLGIAAGGTGLSCGRTGVGTLPWARLDEFAQMASSRAAAMAQRNEANI